MGVNCCANVRATNLRNTSSTTPRTPPSGLAKAPCKHLLWHGAPHELPCLRTTWCTWCLPEGVSNARRLRAQILQQQINVEEGFSGSTSKMEGSIGLWGSAGLVLQQLLSSGIRRAIAAPTNACHAEDNSKLTEVECACGLHSTVSFCAVLRLQLAVAPCMDSSRDVSSNGTQCPCRNLLTRSCNFAFGTNPPLEGLCNNILGNKKKNFLPQILVVRFGMC